MERALYQLWNPEKDNDDAPLHDCHKATIGAFQGAPEAIANRCGFVRWFSDKFEEDRAARLEVSRAIRDEERKETNAKYVELGKKAEKEEEATKEVRARISVDPKVVAAVDSQLRKAGIEIVGGQLAVSPQSKIDPYPLHAYIQRLQGSATIPGYFPGVRDIPLDDLFVEVSTAEDQRGLALENLNPKNWSHADRAKPDHLEVWQSATKSKRVTLPFLFHKTREKAAVLFGDPGSGKSTLTRYLLHRIGRSIVNTSLHLGVNGIPFRVSLPELAKNGHVDDYCIARYVVRNHLEISGKEAAAWVDLLYQLARINSAFGVVFLLDGIDELTPEPDLFQKVTEAAAKILPGCFAVWTTRRAGFKPPKGGFYAFEMVELSERSIQAFVVNWFDKVTHRTKAFAESYIRWIFAEPRRQDMASSPCLLSLLCFLNQDRKEGYFLQASSRTRLYELAVERLAEAGTCGGKEDVGETLDLLAGFALSRYTNGDVRAAPQVLFTTADIRSYIRDNKSRGIRGLCNASAAQLSLVWKNARLIAQWDLGNWNCFLHLTFQEYFAAQGLMLLSENEVNRIILAERHNPYWREIWRFYSGICSLKGCRRRFRSLVRRVICPKDKCLDVLFSVAPLCAEYGGSDLVSILGFDLKDSLFSWIKERTRSTIARGAISKFLEINALRESSAQQAVTEDLYLQRRVKAMVELDPPYFLAKAKSLIEQVQRKGGDEYSIDTESLVLGVAILNHVYHPSAIKYQVELIRYECLSVDRQNWDVMFGPLDSGGRHESLFDDLVKLMGCDQLTALGFRRVIRYLGRTCKPEAINVLMDVGNRLLRRRRKDELALLICLMALCDLGDLSAVDFARRLGSVPYFLTDFGSEVCLPLTDINDISVVNLFEFWVESYLELSDLCIWHITHYLGSWSNRPLLPRFQRIVDNNWYPSLLYNLWNWVIAHSGASGTDQIRLRMNAILSKGCLKEYDWHILGILAEVCNRSRCPLLVEVFDLTSRVPELFYRQYLTIWISALRLAVQNSSEQVASAWLTGCGLPWLKQELLRCGKRGAPLSSGRADMWPDAPDFVLDCLLEILLEVRNRIHPRDREMLLDTVGRKPGRLPLALVKKYFRSSVPELRWAAARILRVVAPAFLVEADDDDANWFLHEATEGDGILFFNSRLYDPRLPGYVEYAKD